MKSFDIQPAGKGVMLTLKANTKAGLTTTALQALMTALEPVPGTDRPPVEREFAVTAEAFPATLEAMLNTTLQMALKNKERYDDIRLSLITATKIEGLLLDKPAASFGRQPKKVKVEGDIVKGEDGLWFVTISLN
jgi:hypothetical protein